MHENFSHIKELLLNIYAEKSPSFYFNRDFNFSFVHLYNVNDKTLNINIGEAGRLLESFICEQTLLEKMKDTKYNIENLLKVEYFVGTDFKELVNDFKKLLDEEKNKNGEIEKNDEINCDYMEYNDNAFHNKKNIKKRENLQHNQNINKIETIEEREQDDNPEKDENTIILPKSNTIILSADSFEELMAKVEDLKNKKIIQCNSPIESENNITCY